MLRSKIELHNLVREVDIRYRAGPVSDSKRHMLLLVKSNPTCNAAVFRIYGHIGIGIGEVLCVNAHFIGVESNLRPGSHEDDLFLLLRTKASWKNGAIGVDENRPH